MKMELPTEKPFLVTVKFEKYGTYTINARSKEHAIEMYNDGDYGWSDYSEDFGEFNEVIDCLLYTSPSPRDLSTSRMPSSA